MGLSTSDSTGKIFVNILNGKLTTKCDKEDPLAVERKNKNDQTVYEVYHDKLSGYITSMTIEKTDFGKILEVNMEDGMEKFTLSIPIESKYFDSFAAKIGNADLSKEVSLAPYSFKPKDRENKMTGFNIYQDGVKLDYYFSKENPKGKPFPEKENMEEDEWKIFKLQERKFYCDFITQLEKSRTEAIVADEEKQDDLPF